MNQVVGFHKQISRFKYGTSYAHLETEQWASVLNASVQCDYNYTDAGTKFLYLGNNYTPGDNPETPTSLNMFGGFSEDYYKSLVKFLETDGDFYSINYKIPFTYLDNIVKRAKSMTKSTFSGVDLDTCKQIRDKALSVENITVEQKAAETNSIMIGDSHGYSMAKFGTPTKKVLAATLHGVLSKELLTHWFNEIKAEHISLMFGSVDIMFHIFRQENPYKSLDYLIENYIKQIKLLTQNGPNGRTVEICAPVPVCGENRKLTKTTSYLGEHYFGTRDERVDATLYFIERVHNLIANESQITLATYPIEWYYQSEELIHLKLERNIGHHINLVHSRMRNFNIQEKW